MPPTPRSRYSATSSTAPKTGCVKKAPVLHPLGGAPQWPQAMDKGPLTARNPQRATKCTEMFLQFRVSVPDLPRMEEKIPERTTDFLASARLLRSGLQTDPGIQLPTIFTGLKRSPVGSQSRLPSPRFTTPSHPQLRLLPNRTHRIRTDHQSNFQG